MSKTFDAAYQEIMLSKVKLGVPHVVVLDYGKQGIREELITYHKDTGVYTYNLGRNEMHLNLNANIKPYHVFFDVQFTYKKERGEEFYKVFARVICSQHERLEVAFCRSGVNLDEIKISLLEVLRNHIDDNTASLGMKMSYKTGFKKYRGKIVPDIMTATNYIGSTATKWKNLVI